MVPQVLRQTKPYQAFSRHVMSPLRLHAEYVCAGVRAALGKDCIPAYWFRDTNFRDTNWGDALNPYLIEALSGRPAQFTRHPRLVKYFVVGSSIGSVDSNSVVWGAGAVSSDVILRERPKQVHAVRGPLTRELMVAQGCDVPEVYGDPALLMPCFYDPDVDVKYDVGIVPHFVDKQHPWLDPYRGSSEVCIIDVEDDRLRFIRQIKRCRHIISSSLHGIICADAYGVPATWLRLSDRVIGDGFKFRDYFASVGRAEYAGVQATGDVTIERIVENHDPYEVRIDLEALLDVCPFR